MTQQVSVLIAVFVACSVGCGDGVSFAPVSGRVTLNDKPLPDAYVVFQPNIGKPDEISQGMTDDDGNYTLTGLQGKDGAKVGDHTVSITTVPPDAMDDERSPLPRDLVPQKYRDRPLEFTVANGDNDATFELSK